MTGRPAGGAARRRDPGSHWGLVAIGLLTLLLALLVQGYDRHEVGHASTVATASGPAGAVRGGGPVVYRDQHGALTSRRLPDRTVALTFDDGPDPRWTPRVLEVLRRAGVPATFFPIGARTVDHPELVRAELRAGHEVGLHTWTHAQLDRIPVWRQNLELSVDQLTVAGAVGRTTALLRPPYSSTPDALTARDLTVLARDTGEGYLVVLADRDSEDWRNPGVGRIVANALPRDGRGAVVLFHDAGGDRAQTLRALPQVIAALKARGYRFTTVSGGLGLPPTAGLAPVGTLRHLQGMGLLVAVRLSAALATVLTWLLLPLGALAVVRTLVLVGMARWHVRVAGRRLGGHYLPPVSVLVPAYNEAVGIAASVRSLAASDYPELEVVVVDDGSTDGTAAIVESLGLPRVRVVRQANAGKAAALTRGIAESHHPVVVMVDGDTVFEPQTVRRLVQPLAAPSVGAVSGNTKVGNRRGVLGRWQHLEYVVGFNLDRRMYDLLHCMPTVPGAIGAFRREALEAVGGVSGDTLAEDTDLTMAVNRTGWHVVYEERARAWTEAPSSLAGLWRQRYRWCYGTLQAVWKHRGAVSLRRRPGRGLGLVGLPYLLAFQVLLPLLAPVIDIYALYGLFFLSPVKVAAYWLGFLALQVVTGAYALRLDRESLRPLWVLPLQQFVYRQLMYLVVVQSVISAVAGVALRWHKLERTGDVVATVPPQGAAPALESEPAR